MSGPARPAEGELAFGVERIAAGADGKAVRLADVVRWLMARKQTVRADAVERFLLPELEHKAPRLYWLRAGGFAQPLANTEWFATRSGAPEHIGRRVYSAGIDSNGQQRPVPDHRPISKSLGTGAAGAVAWLRRFWAHPQNGDSILNDKEAWAPYLALSEADARACWGWMPAGDVVPAPTPAANVTALPAVVVPEDPKTWAELVKFRKANPSALWLPAHKGILKEEAASRSSRPNAHGVRKEMAEQLGMTESRLNDLIRKAEESGKRGAARAGR